jgi:ABC-type Fe3+/spermidine/putrescine transport system ATPase subunit
MIRPERIDISAEPNPDVPNCLHGVIQDESYLGTTVQYTVQTDYPTSIIVNQQWRGMETSPYSLGVQNRDKRETYRFKQGDTVYLQWAAENAIVLKTD